MSQLAMCYSLANPRCSESINAYKRSKNKLIPPLLAAAQPVAVLWPTAPAPSAFSLGDRHWLKVLLVWRGQSFLFQSNLSHWVHICFCLHLCLFSRARPSSWARRCRYGKARSGATHICVRGLFCSGPFWISTFFSCATNIDARQEKSNDDQNKLCFSIQLHHVTLTVRAGSFGCRWRKSHI